MLTAGLRLAPLARRLRDGRMPVRTHVSRCLERTEAMETQLQALVPEQDRRARLLRASEALEQHGQTGAARGPLHGVLVGIKDIIHVDGHATRAGADLPAGIFSGPEAECVRRLRAAGALVLGKTVTSELAYFEPGPTRNPHDTQHTPGGSSSGSAAAVAAGYCGLALGTQTVGSIVRPAAFCGVVGFKPSFGRVDMHGIVPFSPAVDTLGFFTQDVAGMQLAARVVCGTLAPSLSVRPVLGVPAGAYLEQADAMGLQLFETQVAQLRAAGYRVETVLFPENIAAVNQRHRVMIAAEAARVHAGWYAVHGDRCRPRTRAIMQQGRQVADSELREARAGRQKLRQLLQRTMEQRGIQVWISPAACGPAPRSLATTGDPVMNLPWTHAGVPVIGLPAGGDSNGLPVGLQCAAAWGCDERLLGWARCLDVDLHRRVRRPEIGVRRPGIGTSGEQSCE